EGGRRRQFRGSPLADAHAPPHPAGRAVDPPEGRLLPRRPLPDPAGRGPALQRGVPPAPDTRPGERPRAVPAVDIAHRDRRGPMRHLYRALTVLGGSRAQRVMGVATLAGLAATVVIGLFVGPPDATQGDVQRLMYVHVP